MRPMLCTCLDLLIFLLTGQRDFNFGTFAMCLCFCFCCRPPPTIDLSKYTIAQILNHSLHTPEHDEASEHHHPHAAPLRRLAWLVNASDSDVLKETLADEHAKLTFLAPDE